MTVPLLGRSMSEHLPEETLREPFDRIVNEILSVWRGPDIIPKILTTCLLAEGHILLIGHFGVGKTTLAKTFAQVIGGSFNRIQGTPDLLPSDILGTYVWDQSKGAFVLKKGPIFANVVMVDEINRLSPRTQAALLEAMQERQVTIEGVTLPLPRPFIVIATQVHLETEEFGVAPLPKVQRDRFLASIPIVIPDRSTELEILRNIDRIERAQPRQVVTLEEISRLILATQRVYVHDDVYNYILDIVSELRSQPEIEPVSVRAGIALVKLSRAWALMHGRDYVVPDDVKQIALYALYHRLIPRRGYELGPSEVMDILHKVLERTPAPR